MTETTKKGKFKEEYGLVFTQGGREMSLGPNQ
jgi:hypothetical protein